MKALSDVTGSQNIFPPEVLCEIFWHLDSHGLLAAKLTCRSFYDATRSRQFWYRFIGSFELMRGGSKIDRPLERFTVLDLERWVIRRLRAYESWFLDSPLSFRVRQFQYSPKAGIYQAELLPGGRWLLTTTPCGQFFAYDLDAPGIEPQPLFGFGEYCDEEEMHENLTSFSIWVDSSREILSFRAVICGWWGPVAEGHLNKTQIYEATLEGDGQKFRSTGTPLYTSWTHGDDKSSVAISDKYLAEVWTVENGMGGFRPVLLVCQYDMAGEVRSSQLEARVELVTTEILYHIHIIDDCIVVAGYTFIEVYTISQIQNLGKQQKLSPLHRLQFSLTSHIRRLVQPFSYQGFLWMIFVTHREDIRVMRLALTTSDCPLEVTLGCDSPDWDRLARPTYFNQTVTVSLHYQTIHVLAYSWDKDLTERHFHVNHYQLPERDHRWGHPSIVGADATTGRIVLLCRSQKLYVILDTE
ncbi:hypothetical protein P691DRAFT_758376 [Macrolepiota fuliginosa MF-IS2]|uniref:F-box domain-containing protein n=1 Tax=Macrolepiota fuliginosa MF-IS2 TaxID=1400762 RepID=A0A9P5XI62_9AGAR|nr:hypothetical protein P691DRAFT_758376 [Macrolepiota fuliginosa MF-IS2]